MAFHITARRVISEKGNTLLERFGYENDIACEYAQLLGIEMYESEPHMILERYVQERPEQTVTVPEGIWEIGTRAFADRRNIVTVNIPEGVTAIGAGAFRNCPNLENIQLPKSIRHIQEEAFRNCPKLKSIHLPAGLVRLENSAFRDCISLERIVLPPRIQQTAPYLFSGCSSLREITFPEKMLEIKRSAVEGTPWMQERLKRSPLIMEQGILLDGRGAAGNVVIPEGVRIIAAHAFYMSNILESVSLPESLAYIGKDAFFGCTKLRCIHFPHHGQLDLTGEFIEDSSRLRVILGDYAETGNPRAAEYLRTTGMEKELFCLLERENEAIIRRLFQYPELFTPEAAEKLRQWTFEQVHNNRTTSFCAAVLDFTHLYFPERPDDSLL